MRITRKEDGSYAAILKVQMGTLVTHGPSREEVLDEMLSLMLDFKEARMEVIGLTGESYTCIDYDAFNYINTLLREE